MVPSSVRPSMRAWVNMKVGTRTESRSSSRDLNFTATLAFGPNAARFSASAPIFTPDLSVAMAVTKLRRPRHSRISGSRTVEPKARPSAVSPWPRSNPINSSWVFISKIAPKLSRAAARCRLRAPAPARPFQISDRCLCRAARRNNPPPPWNIPQSTPRQIAAIRAVLCQ